MRINATIASEPPSRVAGAEQTTLHSLPASKFHAMPDGSCYHLKLDAFGSEAAADVSLVVAANELVVKAGSAARTHIGLPEGVDAEGIWADLSAGSLDIHVPVKK